MSSELPEQRLVHSGAHVPMLLLVNNSLDRHALIAKDSIDQDGFLRDQPLAEP